MSYPPTKRTGWQPSGSPRTVNNGFLLQGLDGVIETLSTGTSPVIAVPGCPRMWKGSPPTTVPADRGEYYADGNACHMGHRSPLVPIFAAIDTLHGNFRYQELDLVTDRNNLRKLLRCINQQHDEAFRIDVDLVGKTCLLTRRDEVTKETITEFRGFGHEYEKAATKPRRGSEAEVGHHRIVTYDFGGLRVLLRYEVDACTESKSDDSDLLTSFSSLTIGDQRPTSQQDLAYVNRFGIRVKLTNPRSVVPQSRVIEIKTRSSHRTLDWKEAYPQLYLSQTPYLYLAKHTKGSFHPVEKINLNGQAVIPYANEAKGAMSKLEVLLGSILKAVRKQGEGKPLSLVYSEGKLKLYKRKEGSGKPIDVEISRKFHGGKSS
ncbi:hypothetical protein J3A83DRAFT_969411 [Scleroderma citrinum]